VWKVDLPALARSAAGIFFTTLTFAEQPVMPNPIVIAHRGASGYLPEHTLEAYSLAIAQGADYIEPDLVATKDGYLIARHEPNIINTTDVRAHSEFQDRKRKVEIDGVEEEGFFVADFTLAEIRTLRAVQQFAERDQSLNGKFKIPIFEEIIELAQRKARELQRSIGIYPETKHPTYHQVIGLPLEDRLIAALSRANWNSRDAPVFIQSFETANLRYLRGITKIRLVQLVSASGVAADGALEYTAPYGRPYDWTVSGDARLSSDLLTVQGLAEVSSYADAIGVWKRFIVSTSGENLSGLAAYNEANRKLVAATRLVDDAHRAGLLVHAWTLRNEQHRLAADYQGNPLNEYLQFYQLGVDGLFSDFPDTAVAARYLHRLHLDSNYGACLTGSGCAP
jgi:glycerophosphoryl diester phosphodiesterase